MNDILRATVHQIRVESAYLPPVILNDPFGPGAPSPASDAALRLLKPKITVVLAGGGTVTRAPWGDPGAGRWPTVKLAIIAAGALALVAVLAHLRG